MPHLIRAFGGDAAADDFVPQTCFEVTSSTATLASRFGRNDGARRCLRSSLTASKLHAFSHHHALELNMLRGTGHENLSSPFKQQVLMVLICPIDYGPTAI